MTARVSRLITSVFSLFAGASLAAQPSEPAQAVQKLPPGVQAALIARMQQVASLADRQDERELRDLWLEHYDTDASGVIDTEAEAAAVDCEVWRAFDAAFQAQGVDVRARWGLAFPWEWSGAALGFADDLRDGVRDQFRWCVGPAPFPSTLSDHGGDVGPPVSLTHWDADASGLVDTRAEVAEIPCDVWLILEDDAHARQHQSAAADYGFASAKRFDSEILAIAPAMRRPALGALRRCVRQEKRTLARTIR